MSDTQPRPGPFLAPLHALLLAFPVTLFPAALATDITYLNSAVVQWSHFSAWLLAGGVLIGGIVLVWAIWLLASLWHSVFRTRAAVYAALIAIMWVAGLINSFQHSRDAWSSVGTLGLLLSILSTVSALSAGWAGYSSFHREEVRP